MSDIIQTPENAKVIGRMSTTDGSDVTSAKTAVSTPEQGMLAVELKAILDHHYIALHMQILTSLALPFDAFQSGYVLLNGTILKKSNFPKWQKLVQYRLATEMDDAIQLLDMTSLYTRAKMISNGTIEDESVPNIEGTISGQLQYQSGVSTGAYLPSSLPIVKSWPGVGSMGRDYVIDFSASRSSPAYGRRREVAPTSLLVYSYAFIGEYRGTTPMRTTYYLIDSDGMYLGQTIELADDIGYSPIHMTTTPPPATRTSNFLLEDDSDSTPDAWYYIDGKWMKK